MGTEKRGTDTRRTSSIKEDLGGKKVILRDDSFVRGRKTEKGSLGIWLSFQLVLLSLVRGKSGVMAELLWKFNNKVRGSTLELNNGNGSNSLKNALKPLMVFGKIAGVIPLSRKFRFNAIIIPMLSLNVVIEVIALVTVGPARKSPFDLAASIGTLWFYTNGLIVYAYIFRNYRKFLDLLEEWIEVRSDFPASNIYAHLASALILISAVAENLVYHVKLCPPKGDNYDFLACTYKTMHGAWPATIPYYPLTSVYLIITNKLALYAWNFMDVLIIVMSRGLYFHFKSLVDREVTPEVWPQIRGQYDRVLDYLAKVEAFLSPLIFASYGINMFAMCMQLNLWLTPSKNETLVDSLYSIWSSLHLVARVGLVSYTAAKVNEAATEVLNLTRYCPSDYYSIDVYRLEVTVQSKHIGLSGLKCFFITKRFLLSIVSVVFTFEVVLLQNYQTAA